MGRIIHWLSHEGSEGIWPDGAQRLVTDAPVANSLFLLPINGSRRPIGNWRCDGNLYDVLSRMDCKNVGKTVDLALRNAVFFAPRAFWNNMYLTLVCGDHMKL